MRVAAPEEVSLDPETSSTELAYWLEAAEAMAIADNVRAMSEAPGNPTKATAALVAGLEVPVVSGMDWPIVNRVVGLGVAAPATEEDVEAIIDAYRQAGIRTVMVQLSPLAQPWPLPRWLEQRELRPSRNWVKVWRGVDDPPQPETTLRIEQIDRSRIDDWVHVQCEGFEVGRDSAPFFEAAVGRPRWHHFVAYDDETPVAGAALFVAGEVGWLGSAATVPAHRGRGAQSAFFAHRIQRARAAGCRLLVTETGEETAEDPNPSLHNMMRAGFRTAYLRRNYLGPAR